MSGCAELPVILVSAKSEADASHIISEIIDNEPPDASGAAGGARVWRIVNKYYSADVRLAPAPDGAPAPPAPEGHVIYLAEDECTEEAGERRLGAGAGAAVRVLAAEAARLPPALAAWAARRRLEPVELRAPPGAAALRAALHAHVWPGLRRADDWGEWRSAPAPAPAPAPADWAAALAAMDGVRALQGGERRAAAEALVAVFCRALQGDDPADV